MTQLQAPAPLPSDRYVTRAERKAWQEAHDEYVASIRAEEQKARQKKNPEPQHSGPRYLTDEEYEERGRKEWHEQQEKAKAREEEEKEKEKSRQDYLASDDDVINILETNPMDFMLTFQHFVSRGYRLSDEGLEHFILGCFSCKMIKATPSSRKKN